MDWLLFIKWYLMITYQSIAPSVIELIHDGHAPILTERHLRNAWTKRTLTAFVFVNPYQSRDFAHHSFIMPCGNNRDHGLAQLNITLQNIIEHFIFRQTVLVGLIVAQLRRRCAYDDVARNHIALGKRIGLIAPFTNAIYQSFIHVFEHRIRANHIAI